MNFRVCDLLGKFAFTAQDGPFQDGGGVQAIMANGLVSSACAEGNPVFSPSACPFLRFPTGNVSLRYLLYHFSLCIGEKLEGMQEPSRGHIVYTFFRAASSGAGAAILMRILLSIRKTVDVCFKINNYSLATMLAES
jgi:hypothetical protein